MNKCTIGDCERKHLGRGMCRMHYQRWRRGGTPEQLAKPIRGTLTLCTVPSCMRKLHSKGLCAGHRTRKERGHPVPNGLLGYRSTGYKYVCRASVKKSHLPVFNRMCEVFGLSRSELTRRALTEWIYSKMDTMSDR